MKRDTTPRMRGRKLQVRNRRWLAAHPLCFYCQQRGRITAAVEVDHRIALCNGGPDNESNLASTCKSCHVQKTAGDLGREPKPTIDPHDPWPVDADPPAGSRSNRTAPSGNRWPPSERS